MRTLLLIFINPPTSDRRYRVAPSLIYTHIAIASSLYLQVFPLFLSPLLLYTPMNVRITYIGGLASVTMGVLLQKRMCVQTLSFNNSNPAQFPEKKVARARLSLSTRRDRLHWQTDRVERIGGGCGRVYFCNIQARVTVAIHSILL